MRSFKLDDNGDFIIDNGSFIIVSDDEELKQQVKLALQIAMGEWFLNLDIGMDREPIFAKIFNDVDAKNSIIEAIGQVEGIDTIEEIIFERDTKARKMQISLKMIKTDSTTLQMEGVTLLGS